MILQSTGKCGSRDRLPHAVFCMVFQAPQASVGFRGSLYAPFPVRLVCGFQERAHDWPGWRPFYKTGAAYGFFHMPLQSFRCQISAATSHTRPMTAAPISVYSAGLRSRQARLSRPWPLPV